MEQEKEKYKPIGTKVSTEFYRRLKRLLQKKGLKVYDALQMCADTLVRYMDDRHNLSPEMERMMSIFEHMTGWKDAANLADPSAEWQIREATFYLTAKGKKGCRAVHVEMPVMGMKQETVNVQDILERTFNLLIEERYKRLRLIANYVGATSMIDLLDRMIDSYDIIELDNQTIRQGFEDADRAENNKPLRYGERTRRKKHHSVEGEENKHWPTIHFDPEDEPDLPECHPKEDKDKKKDFDIYNDPIGW